MQHKDRSAPPPAAPNIEARVGYLSDQEICRLQNESLFHLCLSLTEGWGHYIVEAMGVGAVTITVDARPMNELVGADRGVLVPYRATGTQRLATTYQFDEAGLEAAIERTIAMSDEECAQLGARARAWFVDNKQRVHRPPRSGAARAGLRLRPSGCVQVPGEALFGPGRAPGERFLEQSIERIRRARRPRRVMQMKRNCHVAHVVPAHTEVQEPGDEFAVLRAPGREALVVAVYADCVTAPERLVAALHAAERVLDAWRTPG